MVTRCRKHSAFLLIMGTLWIGRLSMTSCISRFPQRQFCLCRAFFAIDFLLKTIWCGGVLFRFMTQTVWLVAVLLRLQIIYLLTETYSVRFGLMCYIGWVYLRSSQVTFDNILFNFLTWQDCLEPLTRF